VHLWRCSQWKKKDTAINLKWYQQTRSDGHGDTDNNLSDGHGGTDRNLSNGHGGTDRNLSDGYGGTNQKLSDGHGDTDKSLLNSDSIERSSCFPLTGKCFGWQLNLAYP
jgi:hypothetical protein